MFSAVRRNGKDFEAEFGLDFCFSPDYFVKTNKAPKIILSLSFLSYKTRELDKMASLVPPSFNSPEI